MSQSTFHLTRDFFAQLREVDFDLTLNTESFYELATKSGWTVFVPRDSNVLGYCQIRLFSPSSGEYTTMILCPKIDSCLLSWMETKGYPVTELQRKKRLNAMIS